MPESDTSSFAYFPVSENVMAMGFFLTGAGMQSVSSWEARKWPAHPDIYAFTWDRGRILPEYQLVFLSAGAGEFESHETGRVDINAGTVIILLPDVWHRYRPRLGAMWTGYWLSFHGEIPHIWQKSGTLAAATAVRAIAEPQYVVERIKEVVQLATRSTLAASPAASLHALSLIAEILGETTQPRTALPSELAMWDDPLVCAATRLIWNHGHGNLPIGTIAQRLHTTRRTLERRFMAARGHGVLAALTDCRINRARRLLRETHLPIKRIAFMTGFTSSTHLFRVFRRTLGIAPVEYRKSGNR
jgi:AraC-like DNA-binding protein